MFGYIRDWVNEAETFVKTKSIAIADMKTALLAKNLVFIRQFL